MIENFILILLSFVFFGSCANKPVSIESLKDYPFDYTQNFMYWYYLTDDNKADAIVKLIVLSNGNATFKVSTSNREIGGQQILRQLVNVKICVDNTGFRLYTEYRNNLTIGSVIVNCLAREGFLE